MGFLDSIGSALSSAVGTVASNPVGALVVGAADTALFDYLNIIPQGALGAIPIMATIEEDHNSELVLTSHPVENTAEITDHAYMRPVQVVMRCGWTNSSTEALLGSVASLFEDGSGPNADYVSGIYSQLVNLQQSAQPFTIQTSIRQYTNMLIVGMRLTRDKTNSAALMVSVTCQQVILVSTTSSTLAPASDMASPADNADTSNLGPQALDSNATPSPGGSLSPLQWEDM